MPTLTATKDFMDTLFIEADNDENCLDLIQFLKKEIFGVTLICDFSSITEYQAALIENPLWEMLMDKYDKIKFKPDLNAEIQTHEFYKSLNERNLFLTSLDEITCKKLSEERGYLYISSFDISQSWRPLKVIRSKTTFKVTNDENFPESHKFDSWSKLDDYCLPLTSIVIFDRYILADKSNQKLKDNLFEILKKLCRNNLSKPINLSIISEFERDDQIMSSYEKIESFLQENSISNIKLNILRHDKNYYPPNFEGLHSRLILTNNLRIKCDDSFNFFKSNHKINNDADLHFTFHMCKSFKCFFDKEINDIKRYISRLENKEAETGLANKIYYYKDKDNYLFN